MFKATKDLILPTTVTGSLPRPIWFDVNLSGRTFSVAMAETKFREQYCDAVAVAIADQQRAGLDILVDGDSRFDMDVAGRSWLAYVGERLKGLSPGELRQQLIASNRDKQPGDILLKWSNSAVPVRWLAGSSVGLWNTIGFGRSRSATPISRLSLVAFLPNCLRVCSPTRAIATVAIWSWTCRARSIKNTISLPMRVVRSSRSRSPQFTSSSASSTTK